MELLFENWKIRVQGEPIPHQYDNEAWELSLRGYLPAGWSWQAMIGQGEHLDIIDLPLTENGAAARLTAKNLALSGPYAIQIRGTNGTQVRHSNLIRVFIPGSLSGDAAWPSVPTAFSQIETRIREMGSHPPMPGAEGYWLLWDPDKEQYVQSEIEVPRAQAGADGHTPVKGTDYWTAADKQKIVSAVLEALPDGTEVSY